MTLGIIENRESGLSVRNKLNANFAELAARMLFVQNITVSLPAGVTMGRYATGQTILAAGKTIEEVLRDIAIVDIAPTYTPATITLVDTVANTAEVGTSYNNTLTATFTQNDAGSLSVLRIQKNGADLTPNGSASPLARADSGIYPNGTTTYLAYANYNAGAPKNYLPSNNPDLRTPLVRNVNAPQAAEGNFISGSVTITGLYRQFFGPATPAPTTSGGVRALPSSRFVNAGNVFLLNTATTGVVFNLAIPAYMTLISILDLDALNANITASYVLSTFNVNDAGGSPVAYKIYRMTIAVPYAVNHRHQITVA